MRFLLMVFISLFSISEAMAIDWELSLRSGYNGNSVEGVDDTEDAILYGASIGANLNESSQIGINYANTIYDLEDSEDSEQYDYLLGYYRHTFPINDSFSPFAELGIGVVDSGAENDTPTAVAVSIGANWKFEDWVLFAESRGIAWKVTIPDIPELEIESNSIDVTSGQVSMGIRYDF